MLKKTVKSLVELLKKQKVLTPTLLFSEVASVYKLWKDNLKAADPDETMSSISSFLLMVTSLGLLFVILVICFIVGGSI